MAHLSVHYDSSVLGMMTSMEVILPDRARSAYGELGVAPEAPYKTLYLLHGMSDDHTMWCRRTAIERYADAHHLAVVMPTTALGWYTDSPTGQKWYTHIAEELPGICREFFPCLSPRREDTFAAGLSMGGYGALKLGLRAGERFSRVASLSGAVDIARDHWPDAPLFNQLFGTNEAAKGTFNDLMTAAEENTRNRPKVYLWCGTEDFLYAQNTRMRDHLRALGYDLTYEEGPGDHQWKYWDDQIERVIDWLLA